MVEFIDKTSDKQGTPLNRGNLMAVQGFISVDTEFVTDANGNITAIKEINSKGEILTTTLNSDGSISETFLGEKTIVKNITFSESGKIAEVIR